LVRRICILVLIVLGVSYLGAQEDDLERFFQDEDLESLVDELLQLHITAKILPADKQPVWNSQSKKLTIPGRSVAVRLVGHNIRIEVIFTPYQEPNGELLLVAQGQVWFSEAPEAKTKYLTTIQSIPVAWGEKVLFFPLGFSDELVEQKIVNIQLEVEIFPFREPFKAPVD